MVAVGEKMFHRKHNAATRWAKLRAAPTHNAAFGKWLAATILMLAGVVIIASNAPLYGPPLFALLLTAALALLLVSLRPPLVVCAHDSAAPDLQPPLPAEDSLAGFAAETLFTASPVPALLVDGERRAVIAANPAAVALYGYADEGLCGLAIGSLLHADAAEESGGIPQLRGMARHRRADGTGFWVEVEVREVKQGERSLLLLVVIDATARMALMHELETSERHARELVELSLGMVFSHDLAGCLHMVNPAFARALGYTQDELLGRNLGDLVVPRQREAFGGYLRKIGEDGTNSGAAHMQRRDGGECVWEFRNQLRVAADGSTSVLCCAIDISERSRNERRLRDASSRDPLTGCYNRRHLDIFEDDAESGACWAAIVIDIDHLKRYNDTHGYRVGDQALVSIARLLESMVRKEDSVVRLGGDEFVILLRHCDRVTLESFALRLQDMREVRACVDFTFGLAMRQQDEELAETIHRADRQLIERRFIERSSIRLDTPREVRSPPSRRPLIQRLAQPEQLNPVVVELKDAEGSTQR